MGMTRNVSAGEWCLDSSVFALVLYMTVKRDIFTSCLLYSVSRYEKHTNTGQGVG